MFQIAATACRSFVGDEIVPGDKVDGHAEECAFHSIGPCLSEVKPADTRQNVDPQRCNAYLVGDVISCEILGRQAILLQWRTEFREGLVNLDSVFRGVSNPHIEVFGKSGALCTS